MKRSAEPPSAALPPHIPYAGTIGGVAVLVLTVAVTWLWQNPGYFCAGARGVCEERERQVQAPVMTGIAESRPAVVLTLGIPDRPEQDQYAPADKQCPPPSVWIKVGCWVRMGDPPNPDCVFGARSYPDPLTGTPTCWRKLVSNERLPVSAPPEFRR